MWGEAASSWWPGSRKGGEDWSGTRAILQRHPTPQGPISSSPLNSLLSCGSYSLHPVMKPEPRRLRQPEAHFQYRSSGGHVSFLGAGVADGCGLPNGLSELNSVLCKNSKCSSSPGHLPSALGFPSVDCALEPCITKGWRLPFRLCL